jgi:hypothetical protein
MAKLYVEHVGVMNDCNIVYVTCAFVSIYNLTVATDVSLTLH